MVMKPYVKPHPFVRYVHNGQGVTSVQDYPSGITRFTCASRVGDKKSPNPHSYESVEQKYRSGQEIQYRVHHGKIVPSGYDGPISMTEVTPSFTYPQCYGEISDRAMEKLYDKIKGNNNFAVDLAESAATLRMLKSTLSLKKLAKEFFSELVIPKSKKYTSGQRRLDYVTGKWLEYRYGWNPLVHSIYDAMDTLGAEHIKNGVFPVKGRATTRKKSTTVSGKGSFNDPFVAIENFISARVEHCYNFGLPPSARIYDWTSLNPLMIAWELVPLSFVGDWVVNVSQQLSLWENYLLFNSLVQSGYTTKTSLRKINIARSGFTAGTYPKFPSGTLLDGDYGDKIISTVQSCETKYLSRSVGKDLPIPAGMRLSVSFGSKRQLDAAALVHQIFAKGHR